MLSAPQRMRRGADFEVAVRRGRRAGCRTLVVHAWAPTSCTEGVTVVERDTPRGAPVGAVTRVGFVVSRAVGPAVVRNRVKRRLRHLARQWVDLLPAGTLLVVRANPPAAGASWDRLQQDGQAAIRRVMHDRGGRDTSARRRPTERGCPP